VTHLVVVLLLALFIWQVAAAAPGAVELPLPPAGQALAPQTLTLTVPDIKGSYTIPYIQSDDTLHVRVIFPPGGPTRARLILILGDQPIADRDATPADPDITIEGLHAAEYTLRLGGVGDDGRIVCSAVWRRLAVGTVIGAIGDSITEGYHGHGFWRDDLNLTASAFPPEAVSRDGRNFPQYSPTTAWHRPDVNCFQSWMTDLNNLLARRWDRPVFIANEGVGGITTGATLNTMRNDKGWQARMKLLAPQVWLIHLGVNDERAKLPAATVGANLQAIVSLLVSDYGARPDHILVARPCYDYAAGAAPILQSYITEIDALIARRRLRPGPDFFAAYAVDRAKWYGADPVHPNLAGMEYMARLWDEALAAALPAYAYTKGH
jgi:lysophospholipase L1-like esterase